MFIKSHPLQLKKQQIDPNQINSSMEYFDVYSDPIT